MSMSSKDFSLEKTPVFHIDGGDLFTIAKETYGDSFNSLSPFKEQPGGVSKPSAEAMKLAQDAEFKQMVEILAQPSSKILLRCGGFNVPTEYGSVYIKKTRDKEKIVYLKNDQDTVSAFLFEYLDQYLAFFTAEFAQSVTILPVNLLSTALPLRTAAFIFNLIDCYRRAYLSGMLALSTELPEAIYEDEFIAVLEQELRSGDVRWLLPSFFMLVPGLGESSLTFELSDLQKAEDLKFITRSTCPIENKPIYLFGSSGKYMGLEFTLFSKQAVGFEITALNARQEVECIGRYYLAPTDEANHFFCVSTANSDVEVIHSALSLSGLEDKLRGILGEPVTAGRKPAFCKNCGTRMLPDSDFCIRCGTKV